MAKAAEEMSNRLRTHVRRQRLRYYLTLWLMVLLLLVGGGGLAWWLFHRPKPAPLTVVAFDAIALPRQPAELVAFIEPVEGQAQYLSDRSLVFLEDSLFAKAAAPGFARVATDADGMGSAALTFTVDHGSAPYLVRLLGEAGSRDVQDQARVFFLAADAKLLVIEVVETLVDSPPASWQQDPSAIGLRGGALRALKKLAHEGWQPVYLAPYFDRAADYRQVRRWIVSRGLPGGPVLAGPPRHAAARITVLDRLLQHFDSRRIRVLIGNKESAQPALDRKLAVVMLGDEASAVNVQRAADWEAVPELLKVE